jgi:hypothetical protein
MGCKISIVTKKKAANGKMSVNKNAHVTINDTK